MSCLEIIPEFPAHHTNFPIKNRLFCMHNVSVVLFCSSTNINYQVVYSFTDKPFFPQSFVKQEASERAHQDGSSPFRSMAIKTRASSCGNGGEDRWRRGGQGGEVWGTVTGKGKDDLVRWREPI